MHGYLYGCTYLSTIEFNHYTAGSFIILLTSDRKSIVKLLGSVPEKNG